MCWFNLHTLITEHKSIEETFFFPFQQKGYHSDISTSVLDWPSNYLWDSYINKLLFIENKGIFMVSVLLFEAVCYKGHWLKVSCFEASRVDILWMSSAGALVCKGNLGNWFWGTYLQGRNTDADVETGLRTRGLAGGAEGGRNWERSSLAVNIVIISSLFSIPTVSLVPRGFT